MAMQSLELSRHIQSRMFDSVLRWGLLIAAICFGVVILWDFGFLNYVFSNDTSRISMLIVAIFAVASAYCLHMIVDFSQELRAAEEVTAALEAGSSLRSDGQGVRAGAVSLSSRRLLTGFLRDVAILRRKDGEGSVDTLMQSFASQLRIPGRRGLFVSDAMYKLGMLGTVIGFIVMLASLRDLGEFDVDSMRDALQQMTGGMAVALLTTITGLVCGLLLRVQFNILDALAMHVLRRVVRLTELFVTTEPSSKT